MRATYLGNLLGPLEKEIPITLDLHGKLIHAFVAELEQRVPAFW